LYHGSSGLFQDGDGRHFSSRIFVTNGRATSPTSLQAQMAKRTTQILSEEKQKG
jgi:hypothetical protein